MALAHCTDPLLSAHDLVMLDLDGVVYRGPHAVPGAAEALAQVVAAGVDVAYLTNNASRPASVVVDHLRALSMPVAGPDVVVTSAQAVARLMAEELSPGATVLVIGGPGLREEVEGRGFRVVDAIDEQPTAVVQGFDRSLGWQHLAMASYAVQGGARWYASNTDETVPTEHGIAPGNGMLVHAVRVATGQEPRIGGKPDRPLFDETIERLGADRPLMVGDRLDTDISGAVALDIDSLWVATGVHDLQRVMDAPPSHRPRYVGPDLSALTEPHRQVHVGSTDAVCGDATARVDGEQLSCDASLNSVAALRALVALAWDRADRGLVSRLHAPRSLSE